MSAAGFVNFLSLALYRISTDTKKYDSAIEKRIQIFNAIIFFALFSIFVVACLLFAVLGASNFLVCATISVAAPLAIANITHSHQLSIWPKLLINNEYLSPERVAERLTAIVGVYDAAFAKRRGIKNALDAYKTHHVAIVLRRATYDEIPFIGELYLKNFGYVLDHLLEGNTHLDRSRLLERLLKSAFGIGRFGYLRFYIVEADGKHVGLVMPEFADQITLYKIFETVPLAVFLLRHLGFRKLRIFLRRAQALRLAQPAPKRGELRIGYIAILDEHQKQGIGGRVLRLVKQAFLQSTTHGFQADVISAYIQETNTQSRKLFSRSGFHVEAQPENSHVANELGGKVMRMTVTGGV